MNKIRYILPILFLLLAGCSADEPVTPVSPSGAEQPLQFRSVVGSAESGQIYESEYFEEGDQLRVYCPRVYATPSFETGAPGMYIYEYQKTKDSPDWANWPYEFQPAGSSGFDWRTLQPTTNVYMFEVLHFPGKDYMEEVPDRQDLPYPDPSDNSGTSIRGLEAADMLLAHRSLPVEEKEKVVRLTFYHMFAMVEVTVELPVSKTPAEGLFPIDAVKEVYMRQMLTHYKVDYSIRIDDDKLRPVMAPVGGERKDVYMKRDAKDEEKDFFDGKDWKNEDVTYQRFVFRGIVPEQSFLDMGNDFLYFNVMRNDGSDNPALYKFKFGTGTKPFSLKASQILSIKLRIDNNANEVVVVAAEVKPWIEVDGAFDMFPEKNKGQEYENQTI